MNYQVEFSKQVRKYLKKLPRSTALQILIECNDGMSWRTPMSKIVKVRCNGSGRHVNEVDLEKALRQEVILRGKPAREQPPIPERVVLPCKECTEGRVILTRKMIEENL